MDKPAEVHGRWIDEALGRPLTRQPQWSESVAVSGRSVAERLLRDFGGRARDRRVEPFDGTYVVREPSPAYAADFAPKTRAKLGGAASSAKEIQ